MTSYFDANRKTLKRWSMEYGIICYLNDQPTRNGNMFDCGSLGFVEIWWSGSRWEAAWRDQIMKVVDIPVMPDACDQYGWYKRNRAWVERRSREMGAE